MVDLQLSRLTIDGRPCASVERHAWQFQTGVVPYVGRFVTSREIWDSYLRDRKGVEVELRIINSRGRTIVVEALTILHELRTDLPNFAAFAVADRRWAWDRPLVARDYNIYRRTGTRTLNGSSPIELQLQADRFIHRRSSLDVDAGFRRWTAKRLVEDVLEELTEGEWVVEAFPIQGDTEMGQHTIANQEFRDNGAEALRRALGLVPGAAVWIDEEGIAKVIDQTDLEEAEKYLETLPPGTRDGDQVTSINLREIRPKAVNVHLTREVELLCPGGDDWSPTQSTPNSAEAYLENVIPTTDPETTVTQWDPELREYRTETVGRGTYVEARAWLQAMDAQRPATSAPWAWETVREFWVTGELPAKLGARPETDPGGIVRRRVDALMGHFRQTWRLNRRFVDRMRNLIPVRTAVWDPVSGTRQPAAVWGQSARVLNVQGIDITHKTRRGGETYLQVDFRDRLGVGDSIVDIEPDTAEVQVLDAQQGILRVSYLLPYYGTDTAVIPCNTVSSDERVEGPVRDLALQDEAAMGPGFRVSGKPGGILLRRSLRFHVALTVVPAVPNNVFQFHRERVEPKDLDPILRGQFRIGEGEGPELDVWIPPTECTARFAWRDDEAAAETVADLFAFDSNDPRDAAASLREATGLPGFLFANQQAEVLPLARAAALEALAPFADHMEGVHVAQVGDQTPRLTGAMDVAAITVAPYPETAVRVAHNFPSTRPTPQRWSQLPNSARTLILGTLPLPPTKA